MRPRLLVTVGAIASIVTITLLVRRDHPVPQPAGGCRGAELLSAVRPAFVPNLGQWDHGAAYVARFGAMDVFLEPDGWTFTLEERADGGDDPRGVAVRMTFAGARAEELVAGDVLPGRHHYFLGDDPAPWRSDVPRYGSVRYEEIHPGVDVRAREHGGHFEFDLLLEPGTDLHRIEVAVEGADGMRVDEEGVLVLETALGPVRMPPPPSWEQGPAGEVAKIDCGYVVRGEHRFGFTTPDRRPDWALVVDPGLVWSTFLGGSALEQVWAVAVDAQGEVTVAGGTGSADFPTTSGAFDPTHDGGFDAFVTRLAHDGSGLLFSTFLGGSSGEQAFAVDIDATGAATVTGQTSSTNFPVTAGAFDPSYNGGTQSYYGDGFALRLSADGSTLLWSTFLGGASDDRATGVAVDALGIATIAGSTRSTGFPITRGAFDTAHNGGWDSFVTRLSADGSAVLWSTFLGGANDEDFWYTQGHVTLDAGGGVTVAGTTGSPDFPTTAGAFDTTYNGGACDAFVTRLGADGSSLIWSTFLGGTKRDFGVDVAADAQGNVTVAGQTDSVDFPTTAGAVATGYGGGSFDGFVARLAPNGTSLAWSTYLGATQSDRCYDVTVDPMGGAIVVGMTFSPTYPTTPGAFERAINRGLNVRDGDAFLSRLAADGSTLTYSTFLGGANGDRAFAVAIDARGEVTAGGETSSVDFPTTSGAFDTTYNGAQYDAFVAHLDLLPTGVSRYGVSSPGCAGPLPISVSSMPQVGNQAFAITCGNAPPSANGWLLAAAARLGIPLRVLGADILVDPGGAFLVALSATSDANGAAELALPIPGSATLAGARMFAQFVWAGPSTPPPCPPLGVSASSALAITIQP